MPEAESNKHFSDPVPMNRYWCTYTPRQYPLKGFVELTISCLERNGEEARAICDETFAQLVRDSSAWSFSSGRKELAPVAWVRREIHDVALE